MSFGFSIGDIFAVGQLAWNVYKSCKGAGGAFEELSHEGIPINGRFYKYSQLLSLAVTGTGAIIALHTAIKELEDEIENPDSILNRTGVGKKNELGILVKNCSGVLQQLNKLLIKYKSLGTTSKRTWDRLRWGAENLQDIREKLLTHSSSLTLFLTTLGTGSLGRIEKKLDQLIQDVRAGRREDTVITFAIEDRDPDESETQWGALKEELVEDGFSKLEIEGNKHWIKAKLSELIENGGLNEQPLPGEGSSFKEESVQPPFSNERVEEVSDASKASSTETCRSPDKLHIANITPAETLIKGTEARERTFEAWDKIKSQTGPQSSTSSVAPKMASDFLPTVEDAAEDPSDGTSDTFSASVLPTDSISQVGISPPISMSRDM